MRAHGPVQVSPFNLESRVAQRKRELISEIIELKKTASRPGAVASIDALKGRLYELGRLVEDGIARGWDNMRPAAKLRLEQWIAR